MSLVCWTFDTCSLRVRSMWVKNQGQLIGAAINSLIETHGFVCSANMSRWVIVIIETVRGQGRGAGRWGAGRGRVTNLNWGHHYLHIPHQHALERQVLEVSTMFRGGFHNILLVERAFKHCRS